MLAALQQSSALFLVVVHGRLVCEDGREGVWAHGRQMVAAGWFKIMFHMCSWCTFAGCRVQGHQSPFSVFACARVPPFFMLQLYIRFAWSRHAPAVKKSKNMMTFY